MEQQQFQHYWFKLYDSGVGGDLAIISKCTWLDRWSEERLESSVHSCIFYSLPNIEWTYSRKLEIKFQRIHSPYHSFARALWKITPIFHEPACKYRRSLAKWVSPIATRGAVPTVEANVIDQTGIPDLVNIYTRIFEESEWSESEMCKLIR